MPVVIFIYGFFAILRIKKNSYLSFTLSRKIKKGKSINYELTTEYSVLTSPILPDDGDDHAGDEKTLFWGNHLIPFIRRH